MKFVKAFIIVLLIGVTAGLNAQTKPKFGHINSNDLLQIMPGRDTAKTALEKVKTQLESEIEFMENEFKTMYTNYLQNADSMTTFIRQKREKELQEKNAAIEQFKQDAQYTFQEEEEKLLKPIIERAKNAIEKVAKDNGYTYVFDSSLGVLLYFQDSDDLMPLVKKELGIE